MNTTMTKSEFKPKWVMKRITAKIVREGTPLDQINNGMCYDWAQEVLDLLADSKHEVELWEIPCGFGQTSHAFLRIDGLFYDSDHQEGVKDHMDLFTVLPGHEHEWERQPVWMIDANKASKPIENMRDMTQKDVLDYNTENGIDWLGDDHYAKVEAEFAANRKAKGL